MVVGIVTSSLHKVQAPWLGFAMLFGLLLCGTLDKKELKEQVDWTFLLYLSGITGIVAAFNHLGLDRALGAHLPALGDSMREHFGLFVLLLYLLINLVRLAAPSNAVTVILATILMPLAQVNGVNEWLVGFIILVFSEAWWLPYQCSYYLQLQELNRGAPLYDEARFLWLNALLNLARLLAVYAAFPWWHLLGIR
jgi:di/tricarboxylate transporter